MGIKGEWGTRKGESRKTEGGMKSVKGTGRRRKTKKSKETKSGRRGRKKKKWRNKQSRKREKRRQENVKEKGGGELWVAQDSENEKGKTRRKEAGRSERTLNHSGVK